VAVAPPRAHLARAGGARLGEVGAELGPDYDEARGLFEEVALGDEFVEFLTLPAYEHLD
jgi:hypothetical protein